MLEIPTRLHGEYSISPSLLQEALKKYLVQSKGKKVLEKEYGIYLGWFPISTKHSSCPMGGGKSRVSLSSIIYCNAPSAANDCGLIASTGTGPDLTIPVCRPLEDKGKILLGAHGLALTPGSTQGDRVHHVP